MKFLIAFAVLLLAGCSTSSDSQMKYSDIAQEIIEMQNADLALRTKLIESGELSEGYNPAMEKLHNENAEKLDQIIDQTGYPTIDRVGAEASKAAWLVIQHPIGRPEFMRKCAAKLEQAVNENKAEARQLVYLTDRIAFFEGRSQSYGTNFDWDENGELSPIPYDDLNKVNQRRRSIGLNSLEEQTEIIRQRAAREFEKAPEDPTERKKQFDEWRKKVGWVK